MFVNFIMHPEQKEDVLMFSVQNQKAPIQTFRNTGQENLSF
jgi:hypothetical protein